MRKSHGYIASFLILLNILLPSLSAYYFLCEPAIATAAFPTLSTWGLQVYGFYGVASAILMINVFFMQKWAFYAYVLLCLFGTYLDVESLHISWSEAAINHTPVPIILFLVLLLTGFWSAMD